jgi:hypothetical protein
MGSVMSGVGSIIGGLAGGLADGAGLNNTYQATAPDIQRQQFLDAIGRSQNGLYNDQVQQQQLASALLDQSSGRGTNLANQQLQQATDLNNQQGAGLIASQKGINPALAARLAAQNTAQNNQKAALDSGTLRMQQQLGAQQQLGSLYGSMAQQNLQNQNILQNAQAAQNQAINQGALGAQGINAGVSEENTKVRGQLVGGLLQGGSSVGAAALASPAAAVAAAHGGEIPGTASKPGDSPENDTVPAMVSPKEIVLPRSVTLAKDAPEKAKEFVKQLKMKNKGEGSGYGKVLEAHRKLQERVSMLESALGAK